ncbi:MAG: septum site-determining protein MinD [Oscillospiraceae bacterium]
MGQTIAFVSGKGGTGKTSLTAGVGSALALLGKKVLCIDCDIGLRNLDLSLGLSDRAMMDFSDVITGRCRFENAAVQHPELKNLYLLTAPVRLRQEDVSPRQMRQFLEAASSVFDYCLTDAPAGLGFGFELALAGADRVVVVSNTDASSLRDAQHTVTLLSRFPTGRVHLVVNRVRKSLLKTMHTTIDDAMDAAGLPLLGVVPEDELMTVALNRGVPLLLTGDRCAATAYRNIARRITGERVPLMRLK